MHDDPHTLAGRAKKLLMAVARSLTHPDATDLRLYCEQAYAHLDQPMRVAIVGAIKAGKSTLMNALLGRSLVPTGRRVLTYNVNRFLFHEGEASLDVAFKDGTRRRFSLDRLEEFVTQCESSWAIQDAIWYVDVLYPHPLLRRFQLIDTPGLESCIGADSTRTRELLVAPDKRPHAVVFLFERSFNAGILAEVDRFHKACGSLMSGITAVACLSKADCLTHDFKDAEEVIAQDTAQFAQLRRAFYAVLPIAAQRELAGQVLDATDYAGLQALAALPAGAYEEVLGDAGSFCTEAFDQAPGVPPPSVRKQLYDRLGWPVVPTASTFLRDEPGLDRAALARRLRESSGLGRLLHLLERHFGERATLLKLRTAFDGIRQEAHVLQYRAGPEAGAAAHVLGRLDDFVASEQAFREYGVLEEYYHGRLLLSDERTRDLLCVTGEHGSSVVERLGASPNAAAHQLLAVAEQKHKYWRALASDIAESCLVRDIARVVADSYASLTTRLRDGGVPPKEEHP
jgi:hypothetical protein